MSFAIGDILFFEEYHFTDTGKSAKHFGLVLLPEGATQFQNNLLCCVITSKYPQNKWSLLLQKTCYACFSKDSFACFDRKDLVAKDGLEMGYQPKEHLNPEDKMKAWKKLSNFFYDIHNHFAIIGSTSLYIPSLVFSIKSFEIKIVIAF